MVCSDSTLERSLPGFEIEPVRAVLAPPLGSPYPSPG